MSGSINASEYLRKQKDNQLHLIADMCDANVIRIHQLLEQNSKLTLENNVLKEQLKLAESQIDDLKQQVDELNKAVYQENGED